MSRTGWDTPRVWGERVGVRTASIALLVVACSVCAGISVTSRDAAVVCVGSAWRTFETPRERAARQRDASV